MPCTPGATRGAAFNYRDPLGANVPKDPPAAVTATCPSCGEQSIHSVLHGRVGEKGIEQTLEATVRCEECSHTYHLVQRTARDVPVPVIISAGSTSRRTSVELPGDEDVTVEEGLIVDGLNCRVTGIESKDMKRVEGAAVKDVLTLWVKEFEELPIGFAINLDHKTISKVIPATPETEFTVGEERVFGRLRVTVHAIKTKERLVKRGTVEAADIVRVFAKPTPLGGFKERPDKRTREQLRNREDRGR